MSNTSSRRSFLAALAASPFVTAGLGAFPGTVRAEAKQAGLISPHVCLLAPDTTEGPYYVDPGLVRSDITEGRPGLALRMRIQVVTADCEPLEGARVDLWHCDAIGSYSGFAGQGFDQLRNTRGQTFLRGTQMADGTGLVQFETIYPGWYPGRTTHMHYKVFLDGETVLTSQIFFPDALSAYLSRSVAPYNARSEPDTVNAGDRIAQQAGDGAYAMVREQAERYDAALVVGVDRPA